MNEKFLKPYNPQETEPKIYKLWEESGFFNPDNLPARHKNPFTIIMPPPNVTGVLHMGHALMETLEDIMIRYKRMQGYKTLWLPGTDHAAIATQSKVEKEIKKNENKSRHDLGREEMLKRIGAYAKESHDTIISQLKVFGASCDWSREAFTLDEKRNLAVKTVFKKMYDDGLIYRGNRIVNWDPKGQTTISDDEIVYEEREAKMYTFKYSKDFPISISTTRPETKVGDVAVAVHPEDTRYAQYLGKEYDTVFCGVPIHIKIIADKEVDKEFGTGALGVTPAHSMIDWEMAERHDLPKDKIVINELAKMAVGDERILGKKTIEAREIIVEWLKSEGLLEKEENIKQNISTAERTGGVVEPLPKLQWFVGVNKKFKIADSKIHGIQSGTETSLVEIMRNTVEGEQIKIVPEYFNKTYMHWVNNLHDWCISRQIWYGHRVPVWYCLNCKNTEVNLESNEKIFLVRHGETDHNNEKRIQGTIDVPLNETGKHQAKETAEKLKNTKIDYIVCSPLKRTEETAKIIQKEIGGEIILDAAFRERAYGEAEGMLVSELEEKWPNNWNYEWKFPGGESFTEVEDRVFAAFEKITNKYKGKNILIVSHGNALRMLLKRLRNISGKEALSRDPIKNAEVIAIDHSSKNCSNCGKHLFEQDEDTLDTWFSSALWTFSTLGWPEMTNDLATYHPTDIMETGYEILPIWVAKMIMMTGYVIGDIPFKTVYLHGTVRDAKGKKMSKSLNNGIDPIEVAQKFGADAGRMALVVGNTPGTDSRWTDDKVKGYKNFANKIWNITRFISESTEGEKIHGGFDAYSDADKKLISEKNEMIKDITKDIEEFRYYMATEKIYHYFWHEFADKILEDSKKIFAADIESKKKSRKQFLMNTLSDCLKVLHPFMPFLTEEIWQTLPLSDKLLMIEEWPIV